MPIEEDIAAIARQEQDLRFDRFSDDDAWRLGCVLREMAAASSAPVVIDVRRFHRPVFLSALEGSVPDNTEWVRRKGNTVARFHRSSYGVGLELARDGATLQSRYGLPVADFAAHGGSFPVTVRGAGAIGSVTVSGLPQRDDHALVVRALCRVLGKAEADLALPAAPRD